MKQFDAPLFTSMMASLGRLDQIIQNVSGDGDTPVLKGEFKDKIRGHVQSAEAQCRDLGLDVSLATAEDFTEQLEDEDKDDFLFRHLSEWIIRLTYNVGKEIQTRLFLYVEPSRAHFYTGKEIFGAEVGAQFPSAAFDIEEAGKCLALDRGTACVSHVMRVAEIGLYALASDLKIVNPQSNWQNAIDQVDKEVRSLDNSDNRKQPYAQAAAHLYNVKDAWRNRVSHSGQAYPVDKAEQIFGNVKAFMQSLADCGLKE